MSKLQLSCPCHFGLESILKFELTRLGAENIRCEDGRVGFAGDEALMARANICLSTAERVQIKLAEFPAETFEQLFQGVRAIPLEDFIGIHDAFPVKGHSLKSQLSSIPACQSIIKKAAVDRLTARYKVSWLEESDAIHQIQFGIMKNIATIYLDTSGSGLHKRGWRKTSNIAPIKETLAAGIIDLSRVRSNSQVCDPFCGSGTLLIEAALRAKCYPRGVDRGFIAEQWKCFPKEIWANERKAALERVNPTPEFHATGFDIDPEAVKLTADNARKAGVSDLISVKQADVSDFVPDGSLIITNPPYGERMLDVRDAERLYKIMGKRFGDNPCSVISPHEDFEALFGKKARQRRKLYNGMIKCQLYCYF